MLGQLLESLMLTRKYATLAAPRKSFGDEPPAGDTSTEPKSFSVDYVRELREENKATRLKKQEAEDALKTAQEALTKAQTDADEKISVASKTAEDRLLRAELKAAAIKVGLHDVDGLKLADITKLKFNAAGEVEGLDAFITAFKEAKPYLFTEPADSTSSGVKKPAAKPGNEPADAAKMTKEEYAKAKQKLLGR
jgi:hypothetical protein